MTLSATEKLVVVAQQAAHSTFMWTVAVRTCIAIWWMDELTALGIQFQISVTVQAHRIHRAFEQIAPCGKMIGVAA